MPGLVLIGFKSCGKSTVGRLVAEYLQVPFVDLDDLVVARYRQLVGESRNCREIYRRHGETYFRELETRTLRDAAEVGRAVLATGGGAPLAEPNQAHLRRIGTIVYLKAQPPTLWARYQAEGMPAFMREQPTLAHLHELWAARDAVYTELADLTVPADGVSAKDLATQVAVALKE